jgi:hypothetical protein
MRALDQFQGNRVLNALTPENHLLLPPSKN